MGIENSPPNSNMPLATSELPATSSPRPTLAMLNTSIADPYAEALQGGVEDFTREHGVNVVYFFAELRADAAEFDSPGEALTMAASPYALVSPERYDGVMLTSGLAYYNIGGQTGRLLLETFLEEYANTPATPPMVGISLDMENLPAVIADSYTGMYALVEHLIVEHGYRRIAFVQGPPDSAEARERYRAYLEALAEHDVEVDPDLVLPGDFTIESGVRAATKLLAQRDRSTQTLPFEAVVCSNDNNAIGAINTFLDNEVRVPEDVAVVGFDDIAVSRQLAVPLTTVRQPIYEIGRQAAEMLMRRVRGEEVPARIVVPTEVVVRRSCGCLPPEVTQAKVLLTSSDSVGTLEFPDALRDAFWSDMEDQGGDAFARALDAHLQQQHRAGESLYQWHTALSKLRRQLLAQVEENHLRAEDLFQQARLLVADARLRAQEYQRIMRDQRLQTMQLLSDQAASASDVAAFLPALPGFMRTLDVRRCYVSLYSQMLTASDRALAQQILEAQLPEPQADGQEPPTTSLEERRPTAGAQAPAPLSLFFAVTEEGATLVGDLDSQVTGAASFPARQLLPTAAWPSDRRFNLFVLTLHVEEQPLGVSLFEVDPRRATAALRMRNAFSSLLVRMRLNRRQEIALRQAEEASRRAEEALRDAMVVQRRYVADAWQRAVQGLEAVSEYTVTTEPEAQTDSQPSLAAMVQAASQAELVVERGAEGTETLAVPLTLYGGEVIGTLGFQRPASVTEDEGAEAPWSAEQLRLVENIAAQVALALENQRLLTEAQRRASQLTTAAEIASAASSITDLDELLNVAVDLIKARFALYYAGIFLVDDLERWAVLVAGTGEAGRLMLERGHRLAVGGSSMIGTCAATGEARITFDAEQEAVAGKRSRNPFLPQTRSELALPLRSRGRIIGAMTIQSQQPGAFTEEDITTLQTLADQLGNAIANARLFERMEESLRELRVATGEYTQTSWQEYLGPRPHLGYRYNLVDIKPAGGMRPETRQAVVENRPVLVQEDGATPSDAQAHSDVQSLAVPIRLRNRVLGALNLRFEGDVPEETQQFIEQISDRLALSLESARLLEETRRTARRDRMLTEVTQRMRQSLDVDEVLRNSAAQIREAMNLLQVSVRLAPQTAPAAFEGRAEATSGTPGNSDSPQATSELPGNADSPQATSELPGPDGEEE